MKEIMTCPLCKGLGSVIKANPSTGEFEIKDCSCQLKSLYYCNDTGVVIEVTEIANGVMSVLEHHNDKKLRRLINQYLFEEHLKEGIINHHPKESENLHLLSQP